MSRLFSITIICICLAGISNAVRRLRFHPDNIETWSDNENCNFSFAVDESIPYANISFDILKPIEDVEIHVDAILTTKDDKQHYAMVNATYSICHVLALKNIHPVAMLAFAHIKSHGNIPDNCPIAKGLYYASKVWVPEDQIPTHIPEIQITTHIQLFAVNGGNSVMMMNSTLTGHAVYKEVADGPGMRFLMG